MKIYFGFTVAGDPLLYGGGEEIVELVVQMGLEVLTRHLLRDDAWEADRLITPRKSICGTCDWLEQCDLFMAEVSGSSFGVGFETGYLLGATTKNVVLFYRRDAVRKISLLITGIAHPHCTLAPYSDLDEVENWIRKRLAATKILPRPGSVGKLAVLG